MTRNSLPWVLGISASHNGAVCLLKGDEIVVSVQEERLTRIKRQQIYGAQNSLALQYCLDYAGIGPRDLDMVVLSVSSNEATSPLQDLKLNSLLQVEENRIPTMVIPHHYAHAVSAFATSGFAEAAILVADGLGSKVKDLPEDELAVVKGQVAAGWETISLYSGIGTAVKPLEKHLSDGYDWLVTGGPVMSKFRSLGAIFSSAAEQIFGAFLDAGKVMGLAPYGVPEFPAEDFFEIQDGRFIFQDKIPARFQHSERWPEHREEYQNLASSAQVALEEALLYLVHHLHTLSPRTNLCYAGGVALNSVANERIIREAPFQHVYIIPAAEDSGPAIGAAYHGLWQLTGRNTQRRLLHDAVGRDYSQTAINAALAQTPGVEVLETTDYLSETVELMCAGKNIGWFQGRSELGPRALGQRSIICDPRRPDGKQVLNSKVKHREAFCPFAPVVLREQAAEWFEWEGTRCESQYMLRVAKFKEEKKELVPAVVHVDGTGRVQTVTEEANGEFYRLVKKFGERTGVPVILNTSFNVMGMPIVETPEDALYCLQITGLDYCVLGRTLVKKREKILLGLDLVSDGQASSQQIEYAEVESTSSSEPLRSSLADYAGRFEHLFGTLIIEYKGQQLTSTFKGMTTRLEHLSDSTFVAKGELFKGSTITFLSDQKGNIDRAHVLLAPDTGENLNAIFTRVPEEKKMKSGLAKKLTGVYELNGMTIEVILRDDQKLIVTAPEQPDYVLVRSKDNRFNLKNTVGYSISFETDASGMAVKASVMQPNGVFVMKRK